MTTSRDRARRLRGRGGGRPISRAVRADLDAALAEVAEEIAKPRTPEQTVDLVRMLEECADRCEIILGRRPR